MSLRRVVLIRHAKAADGNVDVERALTNRGQRDAAQIGAALARLEVAPDRVVVSPARRAGQTWEHASAALPDSLAPVVDARIYDNDLDALLDVIRHTPPDVQTVALVGHNPSIEELAHALDDEEGDAAARTSLASGYPTSGVAVFTLPAPFADVEPNCATLTHFERPRDQR
ncbi:MAG: phosphohistidine phosphatase [Pseudonocardiales bacterium]|nr:MAG: phosphohistidine phosphatase [Pseudonocardiales bacterium]